MLSVMDLALVVALAVLKLVLSTACGGVALHKLFGTRTRDVLSDLAHLNKETFIPLFIFVHCAEGIRAEILYQARVVILLAVAFLLCGFVHGLAAVWLVPSAQYLLPCVTFTNVQSSPGMKNPDHMK